MGTPTPPDDLNDAPRSTLLRRVRRIVIELVVTLALGLVLLHILGSWRAPDLDVAPEFALRTPTGGEVVSLADYRGKPVVLSFWAHW